MHYVGRHFPGNRSLSAHAPAVTMTVLSASALLVHHSAGKEEMTVEGPSGLRQGDLSQYMFICNSLGPNFCPGHFIPLSRHSLLGMLKRIGYIFARSQETK